MLYDTIKQDIAHVIDCFVITPAMETLGARIKKRREKLEMDQSELAAKARVSQPTIANLESGKNQRTKFVSEIATALKTSVEWLSTGKGEEDFGDAYSGPDRRAETRPNRDIQESPYAHLNAGPEMDLRPGRYVAIVGTGKGGTDGFISIDDYPAGQGDGEIYTYSPDPNAYAIRVRGDSMRPRIKSGEFIVAEPGIAAQPGDDVVVKLKSEKAMVKELLWIRDDEISLGSINSDVAPITLFKEDILSIHRVAAIVPRGSALLRSRTD